MEEQLGPLEKITVIFSRIKSGRENTDLDWTKECGAVFQNHYPERLHVAAVAPINLVFRGIWQVAQLFFDPATRSKIVLAGNTKVFLNHVHEHDLAEEFGGKNKDRPLHVEDILKFARERQLERQ